MSKYDQDDLVHEKVLARINERRSRVAKRAFWSTVLLLIIFGVFQSGLLGFSKDCEGVCYQDVTSNYQGESKPPADAPETGNKLYIIDYKMAFTLGSSERFAKIATSLLTKVKENDKILIRLESPGGSISSCGLGYEYIKKLSAKTSGVFTTTDYLSASCGYWLASAADGIFAAKASRIGNIGSVMIKSPDFLDRLSSGKVPEKLFIGSTRTKELMAGDRPRTKEDIEILRKPILESYKLFISDVHAKRGGKIPKSKLKEVYSGAIFMGVNAHKLGLVDAVVDSRSVLSVLYHQGYTMVHVDLK